MGSDISRIIKQSLLLFTFGGIGVALFFGRYMGVHDTVSFIKVASFQGLIWVLLWLGNGFLNEYLSRRLSWLEDTEWRFILGVLGTIVYTIGALSVLLFVWMITVNGLTFQQTMTVFDLDFYLTALAITAFISMFLHGRSFLIEWRRSASEAERLRTENLKARFETLKNQVNPHFLFNSFNVLSTLVYKDQDQAAKFIKEMSNLYRHVLDTQDKETVRIAEELEALQSYIYLSKIRFGESLHFNVNLEAIKNYDVAPMTLQMLVENAIKHNVVSKAKPLTIDIVATDSIIKVENNLQRKSKVLSSTGIGLPNIQARYSYLSTEEVRIFESNTKFSVSVPILKH